MLFNFGKCKCLHTGHGNEDAQYTMGGTVLNTTLKGPKREKLHAMHVKELIKTNILNGNHIFNVSGLLIKKLNTFSIKVRKSRHFD